MSFHEGNRVLKVARDAARSAQVPGNANVQQGVSDAQARVERRLSQWQLKGGDEA